jgi:predicted amidophosphoribosyltransferase
VDDPPSTDDAASESDATTDERPRQPQADEATGETDETPAECPSCTAPLARLSVARFCPVCGESLGSTASD